MTETVYRKRVIKVENVVLTNYHYTQRVIIRNVLNNSYNNLK